MKPPKCIIFDLDGVIVSSEHKTFLLLQKLLKDNGLVLPAKAYEQRIGKKIQPFLEDYFGETLAPKIKENVVAQFYHDYINNPSQYVEPIAISYNFLRAYHGEARLALATVSSQAEVNVILRHIGLEGSFEVMITSEALSNLKPHPEVYTLALSQLGLLPTECVAIEDSITGVQSGLAAGLRTYVLLNGSNQRETFENLPIDGFISTTNELQRLVST